MNLKCNHLQPLRQALLALLRMPAHTHTDIHRDTTASSGAYEPWAVRRPACPLESAVVSGRSQSPLVADAVTADGCATDVRQTCRLSSALRSGSGTGSASRSASPASRWASCGGAARRSATESAGRWLLRRRRRRCRPRPPSHARTRPRPGEGRKQAVRGGELIGHTGWQIPNTKHISYPQTFTEMTYSKTIVPLDH